MNPRPPAPKAGALPLRYAPMLLPCLALHCSTLPRRSVPHIGEHCSTLPCQAKTQRPPARCRRPRPRRRKNSHVPIDHRHVAAPVPATTGGYFQNGKHHVLWSLPVRGVSFSLHPRRPSLRGGVKSETVVELFCRLSPRGLSHLTPQPSDSSPPLLCPPSRRGLSAAVSPAVWIPALVSFVLACGGASSAPTPRLLGASLPLRRYVRRVGVGTWPRRSVFPAFPVVHG